jgi:23S rRNA-/tRNA-specific pseudouridylate synthase
VSTAPIYSHSSDWLYLRKPAGLSVFPLHEDPASDCLLARLIVAAPEQASALPEDVDPIRWGGGILHRLDRWTSGLVIAARSPKAFRVGRAAFTSHRLEKVYRFRSAAQPSWHENRIDAPLAHDRRKRSKMVWKRGQRTAHRGRWYPAETAFRRLEDGDDYTLWEATMSTGVMHQIRVHAAAVGIPLLGDRLYGGAAHPGERYFLHHRTVRGWPHAVPDVDGDFA